MPPRQVVLAGEAGGRVARVHRAVAIAELRPLAGGAAFRVGLADDDRLVRFSSGNEAIIAKPWSIVPSWAAMPIRTWPSTNLGAPLAWKETKSSGVPLAGGVVGPQEVLEELQGAAAGHVGTAHARRRAARAARRRPRSRGASGTPRAFLASSRCSPRSRSPSTRSPPRPGRTSRRSASPTGRPARATSRSPWADKPSRCRSSS